MFNVYTQYHDFMPGFKKEQEHYDNTVVRVFEEGTKKSTEGPWPRLEVPAGVVYKEFMKTISDKKSKTFNPQKDAQRNSVIYFHIVFRSVIDVDFIPPLQAVNGNDWPEENMRTRSLASPANTSPTKKVRRLFFKAWIETGTTKVLEVLSKAQYTY